MPRRRGDSKPSSSSLFFNKSALGFALFSIWYLLGEASLSLGYTVGMEEFFCEKGLEISSESETTLHILDSLEG